MVSMASRRGLAWLLLITWCTTAILPATGSIPLLFPALEEVTSLLYDEATGTLLPVQAAFPFFLCSAGSDAIQLEVGKKACGGKVIYTKKSEFSLTLLYLSDVGGIQPIPDPDIKVNNGAKYTIEPYGLGGIISSENVLSVVSNSASLPSVGRKLLQLGSGLLDTPAAGTPDISDPVGATAADATEAADTATDAAEGATTAATDATEGAATAAADAADAATGTTEGATTAATDTAEGATTAATDATEGATTAATDTAEGTTTAATDATEGAATAAADAADTATDATEGATTAATDAAEGAATVATDAVEGATDAAGSVAGAVDPSNALSQAQDIAGGVVAKGSEAAKQLLDSGLGFVETANSLALDLSKFNLAAALTEPSQIPPSLTFVAQVKITGLPENKITKVRVSSGESDREIYIFHDTANPEPKVSVPKQQKRIKEGDTEAEVKFEVFFSERIFPSNLQDVLQCNPLGDQFGNLLSAEAFTDPERMLKLVQTFPTVESLTSAAGECDIPSGNLLDFDPTELFSIKGNFLESTAEYKTPEFNVADLGKVTSVSISNALPKVIITAKFDPNDNSTSIDLGIGPDSIFDFAVLSNILSFLQSFSFATLLKILDHALVLTQEIIEKGKNLGRTAASLTAATIASSTAIAIGTSIAASVGGSVAGSSSSAAGGTMSGAVDMLNVGQKVFLTGQLAVENMPENYKAFADQLKWTMFDIKLPWKDSESVDNYEQKEARRKLLQDLEGAAEEFVLNSDSDDPRDLVKRAFFWIAVFFGILLVIHFLLTVVLMWRRVKIPSTLRFPRLELYFMYWAIPAIATASAGLFKGDTDDKILGAFLIAFFPLTFILWHTYILWKHFFSASAAPKAALVYSMEDMETETDAVKDGEKEVENKSTEAEAAPENSTIEEPKASTRVIGFIKMCWAKFDAVMEVCIYTPFLGAPFNEGVWVAPKGPRSMFFNRYGAMFEDYRHQPTVIKDATYNYNQESRVVDRGVVQVIPKTGGLENSAIGHAIQISGKVIDVFKLVFIAILITGEDDASSTAQAIVLLVVTVAYAVLLRVFRPPNSRWDLGMAMVGEIGDMLTYIFAIMIINNDESDKPDYMETMGIALLCFQGISFLATFLDNFMTIFGAIQGVIQSCKTPEEDPKMLDVVLKAQLQNPKYLERKYYNRWVLNSLGKGVHAGDVIKGAAPVEEKFFGFTKKSAVTWQTSTSFGRNSKGSSKGGSKDTDTVEDTKDTSKK